MASADRPDRIQSSLALGCVAAQYPLSAMGCGFNRSLQRRAESAERAFPRKL